MIKPKVKHNFVIDNASSQNLKKPISKGAVISYRKSNDKQ